MEKRMESFKKKGRLSRRFSSRKGLGSLKTRFKKFLSDHNGKAGEIQGSNPASSDSDTDERKASAPIPDRSGEIQKSLSSGSSSYSDEGSPSNTKEEERSDSSSDSSGKKRKMEPSKKSSEKRLQVHLQEERNEAFRLPPLEETPPSSPPRFSTGGQSDYGRLWAQTSAPNSPANLSHKLNLSYRGGDSSPVALIHSLSRKESGKHASQLSEISIDLDALGDKVDEFKASPSNTSPSLKPDELPIVHHDEEQGVWRCGSCGWIYPNPNPSLRSRREHKKFCGEITNVQRWLGAQDAHDPPDKVPVKLEDSEVSEGSGPQEKLSAADEHSMANSEREDNHEGVSDMSTEPHGALDQGRLDEIESPDQHAVGDEGIDQTSSNAVVDPDEVGDQMKVHRLLDWPTLDTETKDQSSSGDNLSKKSTDDHGIEDQSKLEEVSSAPTDHPEIEEVNELDDLVDRGLNVSDLTRGASNAITQDEDEKEEPVAAEAHLEEVIDHVGSPQTFGSEAEAHENQLNQETQEDVENEVPDLQVPPVNSNEKLEESGPHTLTAVHSNGPDLVHFDNSEVLKEEDESASQDFSDHLNHLHGDGLTEIPEIDTEQSDLKSDNGIDGGHDGIDVPQSLRNEDDLSNQKPSDDRLNEEAETVKEIKKIEPRITADAGELIGTAQVQESKAMEPSVSTANLQNEEEHVDNKIGEMVDPEGVGEGNEKRNGNGLFGLEEDVKSNGHEFPEHSNQQNVTETDIAEGNSSQISPAQRNGMKIETKGRLAGSPSPLEEPPKWVNTGSFTSPENGDSFSSVQKYWADVTSSKFLLVEGKRSPSFGRSSDVGFPSFRNGDGTRSPSPFSLSKSEQGETQSQSSIDSANCRSTVEDKDEHRAIPSEEGKRSRSTFSPSKSDLGEIQSQSSVDSVDYRSKVEDKDEYSAIPSVEGRRSPAPFSPSKSDHGEIQSQSSEDSVEDTEDDRAIPSDAAIDHHGSSSSSDHVVYDLEKVVDEQKTHDLICPVCGSDVTKRIILRKRKRTAVPEDDRGLSKEIMIEQGGSHQEQTPRKDDSDDKTWGCLACLSFFIRKDSGETEAVAPPWSIFGEQERFRCLPKRFPWGPGTSEPELKQPLLGATGREEAPLDDDERVSCFSYVQRFQAHLSAGDTNLPEGSGLGAASRTESPQMEAEEKRSYNCLPHLHAFSWGPIPVYTHPPLDMDGSPRMETHKEANPFLVPGPSHKVEQEPSLERESIEALPTSKSQAEIEDESQTVSHEFPVKERMSLIGLLDGIGISTPRVDKARTESKEKEKCLPFSAFASDNARTEPEEKEKSECLPFSVFGSKRYLPLKTGADATASPEGRVESDIGSSTSIATRDFHPVESPSIEGSSDFLPASMPAFPWGSSSKYDLPSSPGMLSSLQEITIVTDEAATNQSLTSGPQGLEDAKEKGSFNCLPELLPAFSWGSVPGYARLNTDESPGTEEHKEASAGSASTSLIKKTQCTEDAEEKRSLNCLPELLPAFSWGPASGDALLSTDESLRVEGYKEASAVSATASMTQQRRGLEGAEEKRNFNCLPELLPAFSWEGHKEASVGSATATLEENPQSPGDAKEKRNCNCLSELLPAFSWEGHKQATGSSTPQLAKDAQSLEDAKEQGSFNCLPELAPNFSWGAIPVYTHPPLDIEDPTGRRPQAPGTTVSTPAALAEEPQSLEDAKEQGSCNCLPEPLPNVSWGAIPVYIHPPLDIKDTTERQSQAPGITGPVHEVPQDDAEALPDLKGKHVVDESYSIPGTSTEQAGNSLRPEEASQNTSSHVETEPKERASCMCIPFELSGIHWGFTKRTTNDYDLQEPLISRGVDGAIEPPAAGPVLLDDSSLIDSKQTSGISEPLLLPGLEGGFPAPRAGPGQKADSALSAVEYSPSLRPGTQFTKPESEDFHFEGTVRSHKTVTTTRLIPGPPEGHGHDSNSGFNADIKDAHFTSPVEELQSKPSLTLGEVTDGDVDSCTQSSGSSASLTQQPRGLEGAEEKRSFNCLAELLPAFSWEGQKKAGEESPTSALEEEPQSVGDAEERRNCNCLAELLPAFSLEVHKQATGSITATLSKEPQSLNDSKDQGSFNCLPELLPNFSWREIPVYSHPPLDIEDTTERWPQAPGTTGSTNAALAEDPQSLEDAKEQGSCNCLPELLHNVSWGPIPVYTHPPLDIQDTAERQPQAPGTAGSTNAALAEEPQSLEDAKEQGSCNCLPELLHNVSWGPIPVYTHPPLDIQDTAERQPQAPGTRGSTTVALAEEPQSLQDSKEQGSFNCLPELLPNFSWGAIPVYTQPHLDVEDTTERQPQAPGITGPVYEVAQDDAEASADLKGKHVVDESYSIRGTSTEQAGDSLRPEEASQNTSSHVETEPKERASCMCIPLELSGIHWGFTKRTTNDNGVSEPLLLPGLEEGLRAPRAEPGPIVDSALSAVEYSPFTIDLSEGTQFTETESADFHFEGTVSSHKTVTKTELNGGPPEVHGHESNYRFKVDIEDAHFSSSVEKLQPKPSLTLREMTDGDVGSLTHSSGSSASASLGRVLEDGLGSFRQHPESASNAQLVEENQAASSGTVPKPVQTIIRDLFPADQIQEETEAQETPRQEAQPTLWRGSSICLPLSLPTVRWWGPSRGLGEGLEEHLLDKLSAVRFLKKQRRLVDKAERNQVATEESGVQIEPTLPRHEPAVDESGEGCNCLPALPKISLYHVFRDHHLTPGLQQPGEEVDDIRAPLLGGAPPKRETVVSIEQTTETNITVDGPTSEEAAIEAVVPAQGQIRSRGQRTSQEYLKSVVHGGLDVTLVSLGVVASAAGADAKTMTVIAVGLANLVFGVVTHLSNVMSLFYNNYPKFLNEVGQGFVHACLSILSFLFFGALAPVTYGFSFQSANMGNYKMAATCVVALVSIVLLGAANAHVNSKSTVRVISLLVGTGFVAAIGGFETGHLVSQVLQYFGFSSV